MSIFGGTVNNTEVSKASFWKYYKPSLFIGGAGTSMTTSNEIGRYITLGKLVYVEISFIITSTTGPSATQYVSLPLAAESSDQLTGGPATFGFADSLFCTCNGLLYVGSIQAKPTNQAPTYVQLTRYDSAMLPAFPAFNYCFTGWYAKK